MPLKIKFSHQYLKLHGQTSARLIAVDRAMRADLDPAFVEYDTTFILDGPAGSATCNYPLPKGYVLILYFVGNKRIPFCTVRRGFASKEEYYRKMVGRQFIVEMEEAPEAAQLAIPQLDNNLTEPPYEPVKGTGVCETEGQQSPKIHDDV